MFPQNLPADGLPKHGALAYSPTVLSAFCGAKLRRYGTSRNRMWILRPKICCHLFCYWSRRSKTWKRHPSQAHPHNRVYPETHSLKSRMIWRQIPWLFQCNWKVSEPIPYYSDKSVPPVVSKGTSSVGSTLLNLLGRDICRRQSRDKVYQNFVPVTMVLRRPNWGHSSLLWRNLNKDIEELTRTCKVCQELQPRHSWEPLVQTEVQQRTWHTVGTDLLYVGDDEYLIKFSFLSKIPRLESTK